MTKASDLLTRIPPLFSDVAKIISGEIDCSHDTLAKYSVDRSPCHVQPQAVIYPKNVTDIKHILGFAREYKIPVTARGSGFSSNGGSLGEGVILDMTRYFSQVRSVNMMENTVTVDAGATIGSLLEKLHSWNADIPLLSNDVDEDMTVGSLVVTKNATSSSFYHGTIREWVEGLTVVLDNGEEHRIADGITPTGRLLGIYQEIFPLITKESPLLRASKPKSHDDSTGYNLWNTSIGPRQLIDQIAGSEGTLCIITSITFRTTPYKKHLITTCIPVEKRELLPVYSEIAKHHKAERIFMYDETFMQLSDRYHPTVTPFFENTPYVLLISHGGHDIEKLNHTIRVFRRSLPVPEEKLISIDSKENLQRTLSNDFLFTLFSQYTNNTLTPIPICNGMIVTTHQIPTFLKEIEDYMATLGRLYTITGNIGSGHISLITLFDPRSRLYENEILSYTKDIFSILTKYNGGISAVGGEGLTKTPFLSYVYGDQTLSLFKKIKNIWDPLQILNPGKKIGATTAYLEQHLKRPVG